MNSASIPSLCLLCPVSNVSHADASLGWLRRVRQWRIGQWRIGQWRIGQWRIGRLGVGNSCAGIFRVGPFRVAVASAGLLAAGLATAQESRPASAKNVAHPARALAERVADYAGGPRAFARLKNVIFHCREVTKHRNGDRTRNSMWLLQPHGSKARWETLEPRPQTTGLGIWTTIMTIDIPSRRNLITIPPRPARAPRVSLWGSWQPTDRFLFVPFRLHAPGVKLEAKPPAAGDPAGLVHLLVTWPNTRNYENVDEWDLRVENDTGRIVSVATRSGSKGQDRAEYLVTRWERVAGLRLPVAFELLSGGSSRLPGSRFTSDVVANVTLPENVWSDERAILQQVQQAHAARDRQPASSPTSRLSK